MSETEVPARTQFENCQGAALFVLQPLSSFPRRRPVPAHLGVVAAPLPQLFAVLGRNSTGTPFIVVQTINILNNASLNLQWLHFCAISQVSWRSRDGKPGVKIVMVEVG